jgi:HK97 family phage portal protein
MGFFSKFFGLFSGNVTWQRTGFQSASPSTSPYEDTPGVGVDGALQVSTVWACVTLIVENVASLPLVVYTIDSDGKRNVDRNSEMYRIFHDRTNSYQTSMVFWGYMLLNLVLRGNAYAYIRRGSLGQVVALEPKSSDQMQPFLDEYNVLWYRYQSGYAIQTYKAEEILHIRGLGGQIAGMGVLDYMRASVGLSINAQNHLHRTFGKKARRPGILMSQRVLNDQQRASVRKNFQGIASGEGEDSGLYILEADFKFEALGMSPADIQLLETRKFTVQDLARWFGVPSILVNDTAESTSLGSSVEQIIAGFYKLKLRPMLELIEQAIQEQVLTEKDRAKRMYVEFNLDALLRSSLAERMDVYSKGVQNGIYTRNQVRAKENDDPLPGGDMLTAQSNLLPLDKLGTQVNTGGNVPPDTVRQ